MGREGFEPSKAKPADLQSALFDRFSIDPLFQFANRIIAKSFKVANKNLLKAQQSNNINPMKKHLKKVKEEIFTVGRGIVLVSAVFLVASAFMTWGYTSSASVTGLAGDGTITRLIGITAFLLVFVKRVHILFSLLLGFICLGISVNSFIELKPVLESFSGNVGNGLYITILASVGLMHGTVVEIIEEKRKKLKLFYLDD